LRTERKRFARYYSMVSTALVAMGNPKRSETTGNEFSADHWSWYFGDVVDFILCMADGSHEASRYAARLRNVM
jgi:hypothetical protein